MKFKKSPFLPLRHCCTGTAICISLINVTEKRNDVRFEVSLLSISDTFGSFCGHFL